MFGLTALEERALWLGLLVLVILGFAYHERYVQKAKDAAADAMVAAAQEAATKAQEAKDAALMSEAEKSYHDEIDRLSASTVPVIVCHTASSGRCPKPKEIPADLLIRPAAISAAASTRFWACLADSKTKPTD